MGAGHSHADPTAQQNRGLRNRLLLAFGVLSLIHI